MVVCCINPMVSRDNIHVGRQITLWLLRGITGVRHVMGRGGGWGGGWGGSHSSHSNINICRYAGTSKHSAVMSPLTHTTYCYIIQLGRTQNLWFMQDYPCFMGICLDAYWTTSQTNLEIPQVSISMWHITSTIDLM